MSDTFKNAQPIIFLIFVIFVLSIGCSTVKGIIHPTEKSTPSSESTIQKEDYKGPKVKIIITKFIDKSSKGKTSVQVENGMAEMLGSELLATNRFIVQMRLSVDDSKQPAKGADLLVEGTVTQFESGKGLIIKTPSHVTFLLNVSDIKTGRKLISQNVEGKARPLDKAMRMAIEESAKVIVAKTPSEYYRVVSSTPPAPPLKESPKPPKTQPEVTSLPPTPPAVKSEPPLVVIQVIWSYVNLREGPGTHYKKVGSIKEGTSLVLLEDKEGWLRVQLQDGKEVWVSKEATSLSHKSQPPPSSTPDPPSTPPKPIPM